MTGPAWFDNHCHLGYLAGDDPSDAPGGAAGDITQVVIRARAAGVVGMVTVGCDVVDSQAAIAAAAGHDDVWATAGVHPHEARHGVDGLEDLLSASEVVAVGEAGFDFHYDHSSRDAQRGAFAAQVEMANRHDLPLVVHTREAWDETFALLDVEGIPERTVFHCFTGGPDEALAALGRGALLSFSGIVTFRSADDLRTAAALCPLDRVMVETDSPYLAPVPHRGRPNEPAHVALVGAAVAEAMTRPVDEVATATTANARAFYGLALHDPEV